MVDFCFTQKLLSLGELVLMENLMRDWTIKLPFLGRKEKTIAELIICTLTKEWPLSTRGLHKRINQQYSKEVSIQGVHKAARKLRNEQILAREGSHYKLNRAWLKQLKKFCVKVEGDYRASETMLKGIP
ncbi:MAG: hypothetical protein V1494_05425 [Candidatus Diapherotrites archaeon]